MEKNPDEARKKRYARNNAWTNAHFWRCNIAIRDDKKEQIQAAAKAAGQSVNAYVTQAILERMERDAQKTDENGQTMLF